VTVFSLIVTILPSLGVPRSPALCRHLFRFFFLYVFDEGFVEPFSLTEYLTLMP